MKGRFLLGVNSVPIESNIYADKSALILDWLLRVGVKKNTFSLRETAKEAQVSLGLTQRVFSRLTFEGILQTEGMRTSKKFSLKKPKDLLHQWSKHYDITKKCKMWTYQTALQDRKAMLHALKNSELTESIALTLHSAADAYGYQNTNLQTLEIYMIDPNAKCQLEKALQLEPQERGYNVLLIEPYYKSFLKQQPFFQEKLPLAPALLTYLDLYHFPLRGREQAEFIKQRHPDLSRIK